MSVFNELLFWYSRFIRGALEFDVDCLAFRDDGQLQVVERVCMWSSLMLHLYAIITRCTKFIFVIRQSKDSIVCSSKICQLRVPLLFFFFDPQVGKFSQMKSTCWFEKRRSGKQKFIVLQQMCQKKSFSKFRLCLRQFSWCDVLKSSVKKVI